MRHTPTITENPTTPAQAPARPGAVHRRAIAVVALAGLAVAAAAQTTPTTAAPAAALDGGSFAGERLPLEAVPGPLRFRGQRARSWSVDEPDGTRTLRIVLENDCELDVGPYALRADRAAVWLKPVAAAGGGPGVYQVFVYLERARGGDAAAAVVIGGDRLPLEAIVSTTEAPALRADALVAGPPGGDAAIAGFVRTAEASLAETLARYRGAVPGVGGAGAPERPLWRPRFVGPVPTRAVPPVPELRPRRSATATPPATSSPEVAGDSNAGAGTAPPEPPRATEPGATVQRPAARPVTPPVTPPTASPTTPAAVPPVAPPEPETGGAPAAGPTPPPPTTAPAPSPVAPGEEADSATGPQPPTAAAPAGDAAGESGAAGASPGGETPSRVARAPGDTTIFQSTGVFYFHSDERVVVQPTADANAVELIGGVVIQYTDPKRTLLMRARRAVVFITPGRLVETVGANAADVIGLYLEGGVHVTDGNYTLRSQSAYYDVRLDRAMLLDAVFNTDDTPLAFPLYLRATAVQQESASRFRAKNARFANTSFFTPHVSAGASTMTLTRVPDEERGGTRNIIDARNITLRGGNVPAFWLPRFRGDPERFPLRNISYADTNRTGPVFITDWDAFALLGIEPPAGVSSRVSADIYADRGFGGGLDADWERDGHDGSLFTYFLPDDDGIDILANGTRKERDGGFRGIVRARDIYTITEEWTLVSEFTHISDENLIPALFPRFADTTDEVTSRLYLRRVEENTALTAELKGQTNDFIANENLEQAPGYLVDKLPDINALLLSHDLLPDVKPGLLTHTSELGLTSTRLRFPEVTLRDIGQRSPVFLPRTTGVDRDRAIGDFFRDEGLDEGIVNRFDTRQELAAKLSAGPIEINPFAVGRVTAYDSSFPAFSPNQDDNTRLWGSVGTRFSTSFQRVDNEVESRTFDLYRIRHIIEPSLTLWHSETSIDNGDLPVYDDDVEGIAEGPAIRVGVDQRWQTQRGGIGRTRSVDVFTLGSHYVRFSDGTDRESAIGRFYEARPELSVPGEYISTEAVWQVSEVVAITGENIFDVELSRQDRSSLGAILNHAPDLTSSFVLRSLETQDSNFGDVGVRYEPPSKYILSLFGSYNFTQEDFQTFRVGFGRRFPNGILGFNISYNNLTGETSFGFSLQPTGIGGLDVTGVGSGRGSPSTGAFQ